jgi:NAD-dependent dihydropyrimidine dehydrogenase PreA subunit
MMEESPVAQEALIRIDRERCIGCFECIDLCPQAKETAYPVYEKGNDGFPRVANEDSCIGCLSCEAGCRACAIVIKADRGEHRFGPANVKAEIKCKATF